MEVEVEVEVEKMAEAAKMGETPCWGRAAAESLVDLEGKSHSGTGPRDWDREAGMLGTGVAGHFAHMG